MWISRDKYGLYLSEDKPINNNGLWDMYGDHWVELDPKSNENITFENSPMKVEVTITIK